MCESLTGSPFAGVRGCSCHPVRSCRVFRRYYRLISSAIHAWQVRACRASHRREDVRGLIAVRNRLLSVTAVPQERETSPGMRPPRSGQLCRRPTYPVRLPRHLLQGEALLAVSEDQDEGQRDESTDRDDEYCPSVVVVSGGS